MGTALVTGLYRIRFETAAYYEAHRLTGLYPYVEIAFEVRGRPAALPHPFITDRKWLHHLPRKLNRNCDERTQ